MNASIAEEGDLTTREFRTYHRRLPHWRLTGALYFVTWRLGAGQSDLEVEERDCVAGAICHFAGTRYRLLAFVVMNDHVHVLVEPATSHPLEQLVHSWKSYTANALQKGRRRGRVWEPEYFDRIVRDEAELRARVTYIVNNPATRWPGCSDYPWVWFDAGGFDG